MLNPRVVGIFLVVLIVVAGVALYAGRSLSPTRTVTQTVTTTSLTTSLATQTVTSIQTVSRTVTMTTGAIVTETVIFPTGSANETFQFVGATVASLGASGIAVNATYRNNTPLPLSAVIVGTAYPAKVDYETGSESFGPICCPIVRSYSTSNSTTSLTSVNAGPRGTFSSSIAFPSLNGSIYWVRVLPMSLNGTILSPASYLLVETSTAQGNKSGSACGGQEGAGPIFYDPDSGQIYVLNQGTDAVSVLDGGTGKLLATISIPELVGSLFFQLYDPGNKELYVGSLYTNEVFAIDTSTNFLVGKLIVSHPGQSLTGMVYDPLNGKIFGIDFAYNLVSVIDGSTNKIVANITGIQGPGQGVFSPRSNELFVQAYNQTVFAIDGDTYKVVAKIPMPSSGGFRFDPDNGLIYAISGNRELVMINSSSNTLMKETIPLPPPPLVRTSDYVYWPVFYNPSNKELYVYDMEMPFSTPVNGSDKLVGVDTQNNSVVASIPVRGLAAGTVEERPSFFYDPSTGNIYATTLLNRTNGTAGLLEISGQTNKVLSQVTLSGVGFGTEMALDSSTHMLFASGWPTSVLTVNSSSGALVATTMLGSCSYFTLPP